MAKKEEKAATPKRKKKTEQPTEDKAVIQNGIDPNTGKMKVKEKKTGKILEVWPVDANELCAQDAKGETFYEIVLDEE